ncbi:MAG: ribonuclease Z [Planctomycetota bacterium]|nr:ribonuclease Z [Planctomycetota bacterium]MDI6787430.1 ribonuclease Z [Planctomycetota bacterium]
MIKIVFLGTNGWYDTHTGNTMCVLVQSPEYDIILDAGNGFTKIDKYLSFNRPVYLFISHFHLDHIIGLHTLNKFNFKEGLHIAGPEGLNNVLDTLIRPPFTFYFSKLPYPTKVYELTEGRHNTPLPLECAILSHPVTTLGYRFQLDDKVIVYCTDTGFCENALKLAQDADLLIAECAYKRGQSLPHWPHMNPDDAGRLARETNSKKLVLTHFDAATYQTIEDRKIAENQAKESFPQAVVAIDNMSLEL